MLYRCAYPPILTACFTASISRAWVRADKGETHGDQGEIYPRGGAREWEQHLCGGSTWVEATRGWEQHVGECCSTLSAIGRLERLLQSSYTTTIADTMIAGQCKQLRSKLAGSIVERQPKQLPSVPLFS